VGYSGGKLRPWFGQEPVRVVSNLMAEKGGKELRRLVVERTPKDTGHLAESWKTKPVTKESVVQGYKAYVTGVETDVDYAPYVEHGTGLWGPKHAPYPIRPKTPGGVLHFFTREGREVFTKLVMHPGSPGAHMVATSISVLELALHAGLMDPELELWARLTAEQNTTSARTGGGTL
jgi:hypothetical protein